MSNFKKEILLVEVISSAGMYVEEIIERGYKCLVVQPKCNDDRVMTLKKKYNKRYADKYDIDSFECFIVENNCDAIIDAIKDHIPNIACCIAGSEMGVRVTDEVVKKLGFVGNNPDTTYLRCTKAGMIEALNKAHLRAIKTCKVKSKQDIERFFNDNKFEKAFMKFSESAGGYANKKCECLDDAIEYYEYIKTIPNFFGNKNDDILLQEYVEGDEYVVNTVSCKGKHIITDIWKYSKVQTKHGPVIYNISHLQEDTKGHEELIDYAFKVLDAVDLKYGPCHGEYKIDNNGPVLVETNCRPMGDSTTRDYMLGITGNCIVDYSLDAHLDSDNFVNKIENNEPYKSIRSAIKKYSILWDDKKGDISSIISICEHLKTFHDHNDYDSQGVVEYPKTSDLEDSPIIIKLSGDKIEDVLYDIDILTSIENKYPDLLVCESPDLASKGQVSIDDVVSSLDNKCVTLVQLNDAFYKVFEGRSEKINLDNNRQFDRVVYANSNGGKIEQKFDEIFNLFNYLNPGGQAICDDSVAEMFPYGQDCFAILKRVARV